MIEIPNCFYRISIKALVLDETRTKFLVVQEENGKWEFPGGGLEWGMSVEDDLKREIQEEMGLVVTSVNRTPCYSLTQQMFEDGIWSANVFFETTLQNLNFTPSEECVALRFVTPQEAKALDAFPNVYILADMFNAKSHSR